MPKKWAARGWFFQTITDKKKCFHWMLDTKPCGLWLLRTIDSVFATPGGVERLWDSFEKKFWFSWDVWDKWDKNGKILFNLTKLQLALLQNLLTQEF